MFARLVGKHQVGNLLLAALKGTFTQRLGADFELAARVARMVDSNASYKWQMGNEIFFCFWSVFPLMSSAACCLTGVLLTVLPRLLLSAAVGAGERSWAAWHPRALRAATHSATFLGPYGPVSQQALLSRSRHKHFFCFFFFLLLEWMLRWHLACCLYLKVLMKELHMEILKETDNILKTLAVLVKWKDWYPLSFLKLNYNQYFCIHDK